MLQINSESVQIMLMQIMERFDRIDRTLERMNKLKEATHFWITMTFANCSVSPNARWHVTARRSMSPIT